MNQIDLVLFFRTEQIHEKILVEKALAEAAINFELGAPGSMTTNAIFQERGPWDFYTNSDQLYDAQKLVQMLPVDNLVISPQDSLKTTNIQKSWAWFVILISAALLAVVIYYAANL
ncbi:hypothetical protein KI811_08240 [Geobacter hydrogenophilus]|uniref:Uncharacterized protein n=1 Tax=Geobacter hydrogenophilus TaxID=40983 RepID=A0A9W6LCJ3_9BACT|nr:hypothetical protein [Geobacter hydrogenophilus]MBT0893800.1 hypothetical protein [Geobacter hydrogenophilus]GLI37501.1 hypothetical protein GHYDROH2_10020 [Geobacter hydrogenophilus]